MFWGKSNALDWSSGAAVFDTADGFAGVWHLNESGNGAEGEYQDVTYNKNNGQGGSGIPTYTPAQISGLIGNGQDFDEIGSYIDCGNGNSLNITGNEITLTAWINYNTPAHNMGIVSKNGWYDGYRMYIREHQDGRGHNTVVFELSGEAHGFEGSTQLTAGNWYHICATYDGAIMKVYINGVPDQVDSVKTDNITLTDRNVRIGHGDDDDQAPWTYQFDGIIDETRISGVSRSADWIKLSYMNQKSDGSLVVFK
jgi:hypothetical protein